MTEALLFHVGEPQKDWRSLLHTHTIAVSHWVPTLCLHTSCHYEQIGVTRDGTGAAYLTDAGVPKSPFVVRGGVKLDSSPEILHDVILQEEWDIPIAINESIPVNGDILVVLVLLVLAAIVRRHLLGAVGLTSERRPVHSRSLLEVRTLILVWQIIVLRIVGSLMVGRTQGLTSAILEHLSWLVRDRIVELHLQVSLLHLWGKVLIFKHLIGIGDALSKVELALQRLKLHHIPLLKLCGILHQWVGCLARAKLRVLYLELWNHFESFFNIDGERPHVLTNIDLFLVKLSKDVKFLKSFACLLHFLHDIWDFRKDMGRFFVGKEIMELFISAFDSIQSDLYLQVRLHHIF